MKDTSDLKNLVQPTTLAPVRGSMVVLRQSGANSLLRCQGAELVGTHDQSRDHQQSDGEDDDGHVRHQRVVHVNAPFIAFHRRKELSTVSRCTSPDSEGKTTSAIPELETIFQHVRQGSHVT